MNAYEFECSVSMADDPGVDWCGFFATMAPKWGVPLDNVTAYSHDADGRRTFRFEWAA